jgi:hypothetical protein
MCKINDGFFALGSLIDETEWHNLRLSGQRANRLTESAVTEQGIQVLPREVDE